MLKACTPPLRSCRFARLYSTTSAGHQAFAAAARDAVTRAWPGAIHLRQYQEECIQSVLSHLDKGHKRLGISLATGSGKTVIFTRLIDRVQSLRQNADQTLILAHRRELVQQAARHCEVTYPNKSIEIEMGKTQASGAADVTIASVRSLISGDRLLKYHPSRFKLVLVDEAHHIVAPGYTQILEHFGLNVRREEGPALVGVSATFSRFDGLKLGAAIDQIVYHKDYVDMIEEKWLADVMFTTVRSKANLSKVKSSSTGDFATAQLSQAVNTPENNEITFQAWRSEAQDRKSTLGFCVDLDHVTSLTSVFRRHGVDAQYVTGSTKTRVRGARLDAFRNHGFPILLNCGVFTEGTDIPNIDCVLLARPTKSRNLLVQMLGRGMRLSPGKRDCHVIDMVSSLETGIVSVPTLFGLDPSEVVQKATPMEMNEMREARRKEDEHDVTTQLPFAVPDVSDYRLTLTHYDTVQDLIDDTSGERHIRALSRNAWVQTGQGKFILSAKKGVLTIQQQQQKNDGQGQPLFEVTYKSTLPSSPPSPSSSSPSSSSVAQTTNSKSQAPYTRPRTIAINTTPLSAAVHAADTFASKVFARIFIESAASWRRQPASEGQLASLKRMRDRSGGRKGPSTSRTSNTKKDNNNHSNPKTQDQEQEEDHQAEEEDEPPLLQITKGKAADMLTKLKYGVRGWFDDINLQRRGRERDRESREKKQRDDRERRGQQVRVGPLS